MFVLFFFFLFLEIKEQKIAKQKLTDSSTPMAQKTDAKIFHSFECYIELKDKNATSRIAELFKNKGGAVVEKKGLQTSTHAILDYHDTELQDHETIVQVRPDWVEACVEAGELQSEQLYPVPISSRKRKASSPLMIEKKKKSIPIQSRVCRPADESNSAQDLGVRRWFGRQKEALDEKEKEKKDAFTIKFGNFKFGNSSSKPEFVKTWCERFFSSKPMYPIYELLIDGPTKFYVDIEQVIYSGQPSKSYLQKWLQAIITIFKTALQEDDISDMAASNVRVTNDSRLKTAESYKISFPQCGKRVILGKIWELIL